MCALYLLPVIILKAFFVIYKFQHKHNPIVKYHNVGEGQFKYKYNKCNIFRGRICFNLFKMPAVRSIVKEIEFM